MESNIRRAECRVPIADYQGWMKFPGITVASHLFRSALFRFGLEVQETGGRVRVRVRRTREECRVGQGAKDSEWGVGKSHESHQARICSLAG